MTDERKDWRYVWRLDAAIWKRAIVAPIVWFLDTLLRVIGMEDRDGKAVKKEDEK